MAEQFSRRWNQSTSSVDEPLNDGSYVMDGKRVCKVTKNRRWRGFVLEASLEVVDSPRDEERAWAEGHFSAHMRRLTGG